MNMKNLYSLMIASFQGGLRLLLVYSASYIALTNEVSFISDLSLFFSLSILFIVSQGTHIIKLYNLLDSHELNSYKIIVLASSILFYLPIVFLLSSFELITEPHWFYLSSVSFSFHQLYRNFQLSQGRYKEVVTSDIFFSVVLILLTVVYFNDIVFIEKIVLYLYVFYFAAYFIYFRIFFQCASFKKIIIELKEASYNGISNFCSGGILLLLPFLLGTFNPSIVVTVAKYVSWLSLGMLLPRTLLIKNLAAFSQVSAEGAGIKNYLLNLNIKNVKLLLIGLILSVLVIILDTLVTNVPINTVVLSCIVFYIFFSQLSLFDCNYLIFISKAKYLLQLNLLIFINICFISLLLYFNGVDSSENIILISLPLMMAVRYLKVKQVVRANAK
jgi:hypothetical protein